MAVDLAHAGLVQGIEIEDLRAQGARPEQGGRGVEQGEIGCAPQVADDKIIGPRAKGIDEPVFEIREDLPEEEPSAFSVGPDWTVARVAQKMLQRTQDKGVRIEMFLSALQKSTGIAIAMRIIRSELKSAVDAKRYDMLFESEQIGSLKTAALAKIRQTADDGLLANERDLVDILFLWLELGDASEVRQWVSGLLDTADGALLFLERFTHRSVAYVQGETQLRIRWFIPLKNVETFADLAVLQQRVQNLSRDGIRPEAKQALDAFDRAIRRRREGKPDDGPLDD